MRYELLSLLFNWGIFMIGVVFTLRVSLPWCYWTFVGQRKYGDFMGVKSTSSPHPVNISYTKTPHIAQPHISSMGCLLRSCWPNPSHQIFSGQNVGIYLKGCGEEIRPNSINGMRRKCLLFSIANRPCMSTYMVTMVSICLGCVDLRDMGSSPTWCTGTVVTWFT